MRQGVKEYHLECWNSTCMIDLVPMMIVIQIMDLQDVL
jgi:hypothetical protein